VDFELRLYEDGNLRRRVKASQAVEVGRQQGIDEPAPVALSEHAEHGLRLIVATSKETNIPRRWFRLSLEADGQVLVQNVHDIYPVNLSNGVSVAPHHSLVAGKEPLIEIGSGKALRAMAIRPEGKQFRDLATFKQDSSRRSPAELATFRAVIGDQTEGADAEAFVGLLRQALQVVREAAGSDAFFQTAVQAVTTIVGLDRTVLLRRTRDGDWEIRAQHVMDKPGFSLPEISDTLLQRVQEHRSTQIYDARLGQSPDSSLLVVTCAVASPVLDHDENVIAVLYGDRGIGPNAAADEGISDVEATLVEVLAGAVAAGIARQDEERSRSRLAEFFSPRVAEQLALRPELLTGQDAEVSVLFCDIRGFSSISERVGPTKTIEWLNDVLTELSQCVVDRDGVLVDYVGDQLMAMWGAPQPQADHAKRGIEAAVEMMQRVRVLRSRWQERLPLTFAVGIGLNTGIARVGNIGSRLKFKYGVLGNTVNIGSRLQDATKQFGVDCMAAEATVRTSNLQDRCRRLAVLNVVGIDSPLDVYEVIRESDQVWTALRNTYEAALVDFESRRFAEATEKLGHLVQTYPQDRPCKLLLRRAVAELSEPSADFTHVWKLTSK
jgi:adenylate cyclase